MYAAIAATTKVDELEDITAQAIHAAFVGAPILEKK
jgi:hypothetical protein